MGTSEEQRCFICDQTKNSRVCWGTRTSRWRCAMLTLHRHTIGKLRVWWTGFSTRQLPNLNHCTITWQSN